MPARILQDQLTLLASPFRASKKDLRWLLPAGAVTGLLIAGDRHTMEAHVRSTPGSVSLSGRVSSGGLAALAAVPVAMYAYGWRSADPRLQEGAALAGEALANSVVLGEILKASFRRARPDQAGGTGRFFQPGWPASSFPSGRALASWSLASAIAHRYPGWLTQTAVYSLAAAASLPRITAEKHFPSDVFAGAVLGWLIGREIFERRHTEWNPVAAMPPAAASSSRRLPAARPAFYAPERVAPPGPVGPVFVPLDSWVYPALTRLAALGFVSSQASGLRPWTRQECMRQLREAEETIAYLEGPRSSVSSMEAARLIRALREEFSQDEGATRFTELESLYFRYLQVHGRPLADGYNFGQTVVNDYGRPVSKGVNGVAGFSAAAVDGRASFYARGEFQHSPPFSSPAAALKPDVPQLMPVLPGSVASVNRFLPLEVYAGVQLGDWALTVGKQALWWGPGEAGPLSFSNNAEPFYSFRVTRTSPLLLPGWLSRLGGFRFDLIGGELSGHRFPRAPLINGQKLTWNPTKDLEIGFTRWSLFGGAGVHAFTAGSVLRNLLANGATFGGSGDPGDRKSGFDFRWRIPVPGRFVTLYSDFYADDEPSPLTSPRRSAFSPGIYLARLPGLPRWDLRVEAPSTRLAATDQGGFFLYWNNVYNDANTNKGNLLGSWVGRDGRGLLVKSAYWRSPRSKVEFTYRQNRIGPAFLPGGGTQADGSVGAYLQARPDLAVGLLVQYERYSIPLLGGPRRGVLGAIQATYVPHWRPLSN